MKFPRFRKNVIPRGEEGRLIKERFKDETVCKRCGKCCCQGFVVLGYFIAVPELPCKNLERDENGRFSCVAYNKRDKLDWCNYVNVNTTRKGLFPPDCAYVQGILNYHGKILPPKNDVSRIRKAILRRAKNMDCPEYLKKEDWLKFLAKLSKETAA